MPFYKWDELEADSITPKYSSAKGPNIKGEKMEVGLFFYPAGTEAKPHTHPNEQFQVVLKGKAKWYIEGDGEKVIGPGDVVLVPAKTQHGVEVLEDLEVINCKEVVPGWSVKHARWEK